MDERAPRTTWFSKGPRYQALEPEVQGQFIVLLLVCVPVTAATLAASMDALGLVLAAFSTRWVLALVGDKHQLHANTRQRFAIVSALMLWVAAAALAAMSVVEPNRTYQVGILLGCAFLVTTALSETLPIGERLERHLQVVTAVLSIALIGVGLVSLVSLIAEFT